MKAELGRGLKVMVAAWRVQVLALELMRQRSGRGVPAVVLAGEGDYEGGYEDDNGDGAGVVAQGGLPAALVAA